MLRKIIKKKKKSVILVRRAKIRVISGRKIRVRLSEKRKRKNPIQKFSMNSKIDRKVIFFKIQKFKQCKRA